MNLIHLFLHQPARIISFPVLRTVLLDGAQGLIVLPFFFLVHLVSTFLIEGAILYFFRYKNFKKSLLDALIVNLCSLIVGILLFNVFDQLIRKLSLHSNFSELIALLALYYLQTIAVEGLLLRWLNKTFATKKLIGVTLLMNLVTYLTLYLVLRVMG